MLKESKNERSRGRLPLKFTSVARYLLTIGIGLMAGFAALFFMPTEKRLLMLARFDFLLLLAFLWVLSAVIVTVKLRSSAPRYLFVLLALSVSLPVILWFVGLKWDLLVRVPGHIAIDGRAISSGRVY